MIFLTPVEWGAAIFGLMVIGALAVLALTGGEPANPPIDVVKTIRLPVPKLVRVSP